MNTTPTRRSTSSVSARTTTACLVACQIALACGLVACDDAAVQEQQIEKGIESIPAAEQATESTIQPTAEPTGEQPAQTDTPASSDPRFPWAAPEGWVLDETPRQMRIATYMTPTESGQQEIAVTRFAGRVGGELANINRWRGQMGLAPISESQLDDNIERFTAEGFDGYQLRIESAQGVMLAAAVYDGSIDQTWFVRATLPNISIADQIEAGVFGMARSIAR
ncbi:MAG: hypothetical protein KDA29_07410 [Phycisphaerales bacterium]|nr:hypothetical protein [Phycisphaerales bacterium]